LRNVFVCNELQSKKYLFPRKTGTQADALQVRYRGDRNSLQNPTNPSYEEPHKPRAGILEDEVVTVTDSGTGQGSVISPLLGNIYHYVFDLWAGRWRRREARGDMIVIRYADDTIDGFQHEHGAKAFLHDLQERMRKFELALRPTKI
jgi:hypothetical protein